MHGRAGHHFDRSKQPSAGARVPFTAPANPGREGPGSLRQPSLCPGAPRAGPSLQDSPGQPAPAAPALGHQGRPGPGRQPARRPLHTSQSSRLLRLAPRREARLHRGAPILGGPRSLVLARLCPSPPPRGPVHPARRSEKAPLAPRSGPHPPVRVARDARALPVLCTWFRAPSRGEALPLQNSNSPAAGAGEGPTRPLPPSAARSPPARQNGGVHGGGARASDGTILKAPRSVGGSKVQAFSFFSDKTAS